MSRGMLCLFLGSCWLQGEADCRARGFPGIPAFPRWRHGGIPELWTLD